MNLQPSAFKPSDLIAVLDHTEVVPFLWPYMKVFNGWVFFYWFANAVLGIVLPAYFLGSAQLPLVDWLTGIGLGFCCFMGLLPVHEYLHGLAYRALGARTVVYKADWRKLVFYALADRFVASRVEFAWIALLPFQVITTLVALGFSIFYWLLPMPTLAWTCYGLLLVHTGGCFGDFALLSFFHQHRSLHPVTYDDVAEGKTYFYRQPCRQD